MPVISLASFKRQDERLTEVAQTKLTRSESAELGDLVEWLRDHGADATRSSVIRALITDGLVTFREEVGHGKKASGGTTT